MSSQIQLTCTNCKVDTSTPFILQCFHALDNECAIKLRQTENDQQYIICVKCNQQTLLFKDQLKFYQNQYQYLENNEQSPQKSPRQVTYNESVASRNTRSVTPNAKRDYKSRQSTILQTNVIRENFFTQTQQDFEFLTICSKHKVDYTLYCETCRVLVCIDCLFIDQGHKNHRVLKLEQVQDFIEKEIADYSVEAKTKLNEIDESLKACQLNEDFLEKAQANYQQQISMEFAEVYRQLQQKEAQIKQQTYEFMQEKLKDNQTNINNMQQLRQYLLQAKESQIIRDDIKDGSCYFYSMITKLKSSLKKLDLNPKLLSKKEIHCLDIKDTRKVMTEIDSFCRFYPHPTVVLSKSSSNLNKLNESTQNVQQNTRRSMTPKPQKTKIQFQASQNPKSSQSNAFNYDKAHKRKSVFTNIDNKVLKIAQNTATKRTINEIEQSSAHDTSFVSQNEKNNDFSNDYAFSESNIITPDLRSPEVFSMFPSLKDKETNLLYKLSIDGPSSKIFHELCDGKGPYIVFMSANNFIFGYYMPVNFISEDRYSVCENSWIFSLKNKYGIKPVRFQVKPDRKFIALYQSEKSPNLGSSLENKQDLLINFDKPSESCSNLGYAYSIYNENYGPYFLAGQQTFWQVDEIEVYQIQQI